MAISRCLEITLRESWCFAVPLSFVSNDMQVSWGVANSFVRWSLYKQQMKEWKTDFGKMYDSSWFVLTFFSSGLHFIEKQVIWFAVQIKWLVSEAATRDVLWKKVLLEISQNSQESACARASFLINLQSWDLQLY